MQVIKFLIFASVMNLALLIGAYNIQEKLFDQDDEGITWLHIGGNLLAFLEILTLYLVANSKIEDCHKVHIKYKLAKAKVQSRKPMSDSSSSDSDEKIVKKRKWIKHKN